MHIVHLFQVIVSLYLAKYNVFNESGKISTRRRWRWGWGGRPSMSYPSICPRTSPSLVILKETKRIFSISFFVLFTLWKDEIRRNTTADTDGRVVADLDETKRKGEIRIERSKSDELVQRWISILYPLEYIRKFRPGADWNSSVRSDNSSTSKSRWWTQWHRRGEGKRHRFARRDPTDRSIPFLHITSATDPTARWEWPASPLETNLCRSLCAWCSKGQCSTCRAHRRVTMIDAIWFEEVLQRRRRRTNARRTTDEKRVTQLMWNCWRTSRIISMTFIVTTTGRFRIGLKANVRSFFLWVSSLAFVLPFSRSLLYLRWVSSNSTLQGRRRRSNRDETSSSNSTKSIVKCRWPLSRPSCLDVTSCWSTTVAVVRWPRSTNVCKDCSNCRKLNDETNIETTLKTSFSHLFSTFRNNLAVGRRDGWANWCCWCSPMECDRHWFCFHPESEDFREKKRRKSGFTFDRDETLGLAVEFVLICSRMSDKLLSWTWMSAKSKGKREENRSDASRWNFYRCKIIDRPIDSNDEKFRRARRPFEFSFLHFGSTVWSTDFALRESSGGNFDGCWSVPTIARTLSSPWF